MRNRNLLWLVPAALCLGPLLQATASPPSGHAGAKVQVGSLTLRRCATPQAWCGTLNRALDPAGVVPGTVPVYFEYYPHSGRGASQGTLVATMGGPGYPTTEWRDNYLALYRPLRVTHDVVLMDNRGTGRSDAVDCPELQRALTLTESNIASCGRSLGPRAPFYSATYTADDLAALLDALNVKRVDLYGESYGTFFAQVFAVRHPDKLRSLVLDGAYPLDDADYAWYPAYAPAMRDKFNFACQRSAACSQIPGSSISHIEPALQLLRAHPFPAQAHDIAGTLHRFTADATRLALVMFGSEPAQATVREVDAAARAFTAGDQPPLLRLMAEALRGVDSRDETQSPSMFSEGLAAAVNCQDAPQVFDMSLEPAARMADRDRAIVRRKAAAPETYGPFTIDEYRGMPIDYTFIDQCVQWPTPPVDHPAGRLTEGPRTYPETPTLIVSGDLDNITPVADGAMAAANFPHGRQVVLRNSHHVNALPGARSECGAALVRHFIESLDVGDSACAQAVPEVRLLPRFARHWSELDPATALPGNRASADELRAVSAALLTAGDALARASDVSPGSGVGLRGGAYRVLESRGALRLKFQGLRWTEDLTVSGTAELPLYQGKAHASLQLQGAKEVSGTLQAEWQEGSPLAVATVHGLLAGHVVAAELTAP